MRVRAWAGPGRWVSPHLTGPSPDSFASGSRRRDCSSGNFVPGGGEETPRGPGEAGSAEDLEAGLGARLEASPRRDALA